MVVIISDTHCIADFDWEHPKIDLTSEKTLHAWTLEAGSTVLQLNGENAEYFKYFSLNLSPHCCVQACKKPNAHKYFLCVPFLTNVFAPIQNGMEFEFAHGFQSRRDKRDFLPLTSNFAAALGLS